MNSLECEGAYAFIFSMVGLDTAFSQIRRRHSGCSPYEVAILSELVFIFRVKSDILPGVDNDADVEPSASEHDRAANMGVTHEDLF